MGRDALKSNAIFLSNERLFLTTKKLSLQAKRSNPVQSIGLLRRSDPGRLEI
jgi:hypothetical protein